MINVLPYFVRCLSHFVPQYKLKATVTHIHTHNTLIDQTIRFISSSVVRRGENAKSAEEKINQKLLRNPERDRRTKISVETSIRYLQSSAFKEAYGDKPVWFYYRRNFKGQFPPPKTRKLCIRADIIATGSPCPICRDEYLVVDYKNLELLKQFISEVTGQIISYKQTGVCQLQHRKLLVAYNKAKDLGLITFDLPYREYDYLEYKK